MRTRWYVAGGSIAGAAIMLFGIWIGRPTPPPPKPALPTIAEHPKDAAPTQETQVLLQLVAGMQAQQQEFLRLMQQQPGRNSDQSAAMTGILLSLLNEQRAARGEAPIAPTASPEEISKQIVAQGGVVLPERVVQAPCETRGHMHGVIPARGADWELIPEWDPCKPPKKAGLFDFSSGTLYSLKLGGALWGNANLTIADELAASQLSLDGTRFGWGGSVGAEHIWMSSTGKFWHGVGVEAGYDHSPIVGAWRGWVYYSPKLWIPSQP
jgi:hypothetical protein